MQVLPNAYLGKVMELWAHLYERGQITICHTTDLSSVISFDSAVWTHAHYTVTCIRLDLLNKSILGRTISTLEDYRTERKEGKRGDGMIVIVKQAS
jgi:hypothetical protein